MSAKTLVPLILAGASGVTAGTLVILLGRRWSLALGIFRIWQWLNTRPRPWPVFTITPLTAGERIWREAGWRRRLPSRRYCLGGGALLLIGLGLAGLAPLVLGSIFIASAAGWIYRRAQIYRRSLVQELPEALRSLSGALQAGYSIPQAVPWLASATASPLREVWAALARADYYRLPLPTALRRLAGTLAIPEWSLVSATLISALAGGGNIIPLLTAQAETLRDQLSAAAEIKSLTAAGRWSGWLIALLVPAAAFLFWLLQPSYLQVFIATTIGRLLLATALGLEILGLVWISRLVRADF
ncbi:MAG: type II secretion system F family protein [Candidatus Magasanikbacteria bacterium]|nr:type II secretion system F family protein [Candidatus Magasanikbacteria bacterium]